MQSLTEHARTRSRQRGIDPESIEVALRYGHRRHSHGDLVYELRDRSLLGTPFQSHADRLRGLAVVVTRDGSVRTVMWLFRLRRRPGLLRRSRIAGAV